MFSIIIPLYNKEKHIAETIQSAINAFKMFQYEILIINDGSTDNSLEICKKISFLNPNIKVYSQANQGVSAARNFGITNSKYEFLVFLDADDILEDYTGQEYKNLIDKFLKQGVDLFTVGFAIKKDQNTIKYNCKKALGKEDYFGIINNPINILAKFNRSSFINSSAICVSKKILSDNQIEFPYGITHTEDTAFFIDLFLVTKVAYSSKLCSYYNLNASNRSNLRKPTKNRYIIEKLEYILQNNSLNQEQINAIKAFIGKNYVHLLSNCVEMDNKENFKLNIIKAKVYFKYMSSYYKFILLFFLLLNFNMIKKLFLIIKK